MHNLSAMIASVLGVAWSIRGHACYSLCSWIGWFFQCHWSKVYLNYYGSHPFPCACGTFKSLLTFYVFLLLFVFINQIDAIRSTGQ